MDKPIPAQRHILFELTPLDGTIEDIEEKTRKSYQNVKQMIADKSAKECQEIYLKHIAANPQANLEELTMGLMVGILLEPNNASDYYRDIVAFSKDNLTLFGGFVNMIIIERISKISESSLKQVFWTANQLMKAGSTVAESTCSNLIRQTAGGDLSQKNLLMVENLIDLLTVNRSWLINSTSFMGPTVIYNFMRLLSDHMGPNQALRQKEIEFVIGLIKEKFEFVLHIGKDFLRLLHNLIKIPEFEKLHQDIYDNPKSLNPKYEGAHQLLAIRTPRRLFQSCLTFDMERKISFLAMHVKFGNQKRYQDWFHKQYLSSPESLSLRSDLIRYICTIIHPSNEVLCSDIIPRWAIIGWLLTTCTTSASLVTSKQALFFDWFAFDSKTDNIMNIEPAILVMYYSLRSHPNVTAGLLDYLCRVPSSFSPKLSDIIRAGIRKSLQQILEKRVIQSLAPLFDNPKHDPGLKTLIRESFSDFCATPCLNDNGLSSNVSPSISTPSQSVQTVQAGGKTEQQQSKPQSDIPFTIDDRNIHDNPPTNLELRKTSLDGNHTSKFAETIQSKQIDLTKQQSHIKVTNSVPILIELDSDKIESSLTQRSTIENSKIRKLSQTNNEPSSDIKKVQTVSTISQNEANCISSSFENEYPIKDHPLFLPENSSNHSNHEHLSGTTDNVTTKVFYPFLTVKKTVSKEVIKSFDESISGILEDLSIERSTETRCTLMDKLISALFDLNDQSINQVMIDDLSNYVAELIADDFSTRIFPSANWTIDSLEESIATPFFVLCRSAFTGSKVNQKPLSLLGSISKVFKATGFLVLYFLRVICLINGNLVAPFQSNYVTFCAIAKRDTSKCLLEDLQMASIYDAEMFCFLLPSIFGEMATCGVFQITGNCDLIRLVVSSIDPNYLQELICLALTGTAKIIDRDNPLPLIESSLEWDSWDQYCLWKLIAANSTPVDNYIQVLPKLSAKAHPEAMTCITLNLQKNSEPDVNVIFPVIDSYSRKNDQFVSALIRYWSIKTDIKELTKNLISLFESPPPSPQVKRKGQPKTTSKPLTLSLRSEKLLYCLETIRQRAPRNKLFSQPKLQEKLPQMEAFCNESQKKRFSELFSIKSRASKKKKTEKDI